MRSKILVISVCICVLSAAGMATGQSRQPGALISQQDLMQYLESGGSGHGKLLIDVRSPGEFRNGHVRGAINIPHHEMAKHLDDVRGKADKGVILYCESGRRAGIAEGILRDAGLHNIEQLEGNMSAWRKAGLPLEKAR